MTKSEFEKEHLKSGQAVSFIDLSGTTYYGIYNGLEDLQAGSFSFCPKGSSQGKTIYLKDIEKFYHSL
jgi:hypothetical protein